MASTPIESILTEHKQLCSKIMSASKHERHLPQAEVGDDLTVVYGLRGVGKTWWAISYCQDQGLTPAYVDCEDPQLAQVKGLKADGIAETLVMLYGDVRMVVIDEFLKLPIWNELVELFLQSGWKVIVLNSGDKPSIVPQEVAMRPLSWTQYCRWHGVDTDITTPTARGLQRKAFDDYLMRGGLPGMQSLKNPRIYANKLIDRVVAQDIAIQVRASSMPQLQRLAHHIIENSPLVLNYKEMLPSTEFSSVNTLRKYVDVLKTTELVRPLIRLSMFDNVRNFMEKLYAADPGLMSGASRAARLETTVYLHLERYCRRMGYMMHYYGNRDRQCHFAICRDMRMRAAVEYIPDASDDEAMQVVLSGFNSLARISDCKKLFLLTENNSGLKNVNGLDVEIMPVYAFLNKIAQPLDL